MKVSVNSFNLSECANIYRMTGINLTNGMQLCAGGEENKDSCEGDSGNLIDFQIQIYTNSSKVSLGFWPLENQVVR